LRWKTDGGIPRQCHTHIWYVWKTLDSLGY